MSRLLPLASLALAAAAVQTPGAPRATATPGPAPARGLAFALSLEGSGRALASGPYLLKVPGGGGPLRLELSRLAVEGARLRGEARLVNGSGILLAGLALDFESASATRRDAPGRGSTPPAPLALREPLALGELLPGESTPYVPFDLSPVPVGDDVVLSTLLGFVSGISVEPPLGVEGAAGPVALDTDRSGRLYVAAGVAGSVLRMVPGSAGSPSEAARASSAPTGVALRRRNGDLLVSTGGSAIEVHRPGRRRPSLLEAGRPVRSVRVDGKGILRAASGNAVLAFDEAKPGPALQLGPDASDVLSFDADARGDLFAVVREGETRRLVVAGPSGPAPVAAKRGAGSDALSAPSACRFDGEGALWVAATPGDPEASLLARFGPDGIPLAALPRLGLALLLGKDEEAAVPSVVDLAPGPDRRLYVLLADGTVFAVRPF